MKIAKFKKKRCKRVVHVTFETDEQLQELINSMKANGYDFEEVVG